MGGRIELDSENGWTSVHARPQRGRPGPRAHAGPRLAVFRRSRSATKCEIGANAPLSQIRARPRRRGYSGPPVRSSSAAAIALVAAVLGGARRARRRQGHGLARRHHDEDRRRRPAPVRDGDAAPVVVAKPLAGNGFAPAQIFRSRSAGVVTILSYFDEGNVPDATAAQGSGFVVSPQGLILTNAHVITNAGLPQVALGKAAPAQTVYVEFSDGDRVPATVVGFDLYDDVGVIRVDPALHALRSRPARQLEPRRRRRACGSDRQPVREHRFALGRRRLGDPALDPLPDEQLQPRRRDPDRRTDQPRQLRRPALRRARPCDRDQRPDPLQRRRRRASRASGSRFRSTPRGARCSSCSRTGPFATPMWGSRQRT